ncbi:MAG: Rrf2 family transcriptional regulator [Planctomycetota bacterium]|nr:MAG: Rrf2 family transcriptional regulator [Planctomycetota bacterium]
MLQITKRVDYALIALTHLALHPGERFSARGLAEAYHLSKPLMANVLKALVPEGLVRSVRGTKGGYELVADPAKVTVGRLVELLEGPLQLADCVGQGALDPLACQVTRVCPVKHSVFKIHLRIRDVLYGQSIADLARDASRPGESLPVVRSSSAYGGTP